MVHHQHVVAGVVGVNWALLVRALGKADITLRVDDFSQGEQGGR
jgi:hypothetical protein